MNKYKNMKIIGSDETGVGDYLSPLIAAAAYIPEKNMDKVKKMGVQDSKKISDSMIIKLYYDLKDIVIWSSKKLTQTGYNKLNTSFNAHELKTLLHINAITVVESSINADLIIIDQFASEKNWNKYVAHLSESTLEINKIKSKISFVTKGESEHLAVAVASIMARATLLFEMKNQNKKYDIVFPLGTNPKVYEATRRFIDKHGFAKLNQVAKIKFKTTEKFKEE